MRKRTKKEDRKKTEQNEFRKIQKAISALPNHSFNNPEKAQPVKNVEVPTIVPATLTSPVVINTDDKTESVADAPVILDTNSKRIESVARIKKPKTSSVIFRTLGYLRKHWVLLTLAILCAGINSIFEIFIPLLIGDGIDYIIGPNEVNFPMVLKFMGYLSICVVGFAIFKWLLSRIANGMAYKIEERMHNEIFQKFNKVPLKILDSSSHGDLQSRMINDVDLITDGFVMGLTTFFDCLATIVLTLIFMMRINITISIVIICATPLSIIITTIIAKLSHKLFKKQSKMIGDLSGTMAVAAQVFGRAEVVLDPEGRHRALVFGLFLDLPSVSKFPFLDGFRYGFSGVNYSAHSGEYGAF